MPAKEILFIFGDSITYGEWDAQGGWANRIRIHLDALVLPQPDEYPLVYNLGIPGDTSSGVLDRLQHETQDRLTPIPGEPKCQFIFAIGTNDASWLVDEKRYKLDIDEFASNLKTITLIAQQFSSDIIFVGLLPCFEQEMLKSAQKHQWVETFDNKTLVDYNNTIKKHCLESQTTFIDIYNEFINNNHPALLNDGLHPNSKGHELIYRIVMEQLIYGNGFDAHAKHFGRFAHLFHSRK